MTPRLPQFRCRAAMTFSNVSLSGLRVVFLQALTQNGFPGAADTEGGPKNESRAVRARIARLQSSDRAGGGSNDRSRPVVAIDPYFRVGKCHVTASTHRPPCVGAPAEARDRVVNAARHGIERIRSLDIGRFDRLAVRRHRESQPRSMSLGETVGNRHAQP